ncbi:MAG: hypothetical protein CMN30_16890 [Sandaracinus sp.]|nr:hypothetical protein [Sandaracinus sp.]
MRHAWILVLAGCATPDVISLRTEGALVLEVEVERAVTAAERRAGLEGRDPLAAGHGLLLEFPVEDEVCIANGGVDFGIDGIFLDASGLVTALEREIPAGDPTVRCGRARWVLEVGSGAAAEVVPGAAAAGL